MSGNEPTIYHGLWHNYDLPFPLSLTLTVSTQTGNYLIAALSVLVALAGIAFYGIIAYIFHQNFASRGNKDVLDHQLQVLFRSKLGALESSFESVKLYWAWRRIKKHAWRRVLPFSVTAAFLWGFFIVCSILTANVATNSHGDTFVRAVRKSCGDIAFGPPGVTVEELSNPEREQDVRMTKSARERYLFNNLKWARAYSEAHYGIGSPVKTSTPPTSISRKTTLPFESKEVGCPWKGHTRCLGYNNTEGPALSMDTGFLDSHSDLGINAPLADRVQIRKTSTCGVIDTSAYDRMLIVDNQTVYGISILAEDQDIANLPTGPEGYRRTVAWHQKGRATSLIVASSHFSYAISSSYPAQRSELDQKPLVATFQNTDHDVGFWTIATNAIFREEVLDPLFYANLTLGSSADGIAGGGSGYLTNRPFNTIACKDAYDVCNPNNGKCTGPSGILQLNELKQRQIGMNKHQLATTLRLIHNMMTGGHLFQNGAHVAWGLLAQDYASGMGPAPADNQWQLEAKMWFATALSNFQLTITDWASKPWLDPSEKELGRYINTTDFDTQYRMQGLLPEFEDLCRNTVIRTTASVQNFNVLASLLVLALVLLIMGVKISLPSIVSHIRTRRRRGGSLDPKAREREIARDADDKYQLLRMALEGSRIGGWERGSFGVPVTREGADILAPVRDPARKLVRYPTFPMSGFKEEDGSDADTLHMKEGMVACPDMTASTSGTRTPAWAGDKVGPLRSAIAAVSKAEAGRENSGRTQSREVSRGSRNTSGSSTPIVRRPMRAETWTSTTRTLREDET